MKKDATDYTDFTDCKIIIREIRVIRGCFLFWSAEIEEPGLGI